LPAYFLAVRQAGPNSTQGAVSGTARLAAPIIRRVVMKAEIHPKYETVTAKCSCGNSIQTRSTLCEDFQVDVCSQCHPFFTGKQKVVDSGGRVDRFNKRFGNRGSSR